MDTSQCKIRAFFKCKENDHGNYEIYTSWDFNFIRIYTYKKIPSIFVISTYEQIFIFKWDYIKITNIYVPIRVMDIWMKRLAGHKEVPEWYPI